MTTFKMSAENFNAEQSHQLKTSFKSANKRIFIFKDATITVNITTHAVCSVQVVNPSTFNLMVALRRIAFEMGDVIHNNQVYKLKIEEEPRSFFDNFLAWVAS